MADRLISSHAAARIHDGDVVLTYAKSAVVQQTLLKAHRSGTRFRVVVVDSRPLFEGKNLASVLADAGMDVSYCLTPGLAHAAMDATLCILGAHAVLGNGRVYSRVGTALVAMAAKERDIPVLVCAESVKFTERVALDSVVVNELAPEDELVIPGDEGDMPVVGATGDEGPAAEVASLKGWRDKEGLQLLNVMYDVTPAEFVDLLITEHCSLPPSSAPQVQRMSAGV